MALFYGFKCVELYRVGLNTCLENGGVLGCLYGCCHVPATTEDGQLGWKGLVQRIIVGISTGAGGFLLLGLGGGL